MCVFTYCIYTNTVSTNTVSTSTVPDTPSGATQPTVQDVTASHAKNSEQGTVRQYISNGISQYNQKH